MKNETRAQVFFCEFFEISQNTISYRPRPVAASGTKLIHQILDKLGGGIININDKIKENLKDIGELNQNIQMFEDTNNNKLMEIDNSIKQQKIERMAQVEVIRKKHNELKEKAQNLEDRSQRGNPRIDRITEYQEKFSDNTEQLLKDSLPEKLDVNQIQIERSHPVEMKEAVKDRTIVAKFCNYKGKQHVLNEVRHQKREEIQACKDFFKAAVAIRKENLEKLKALRHQGNTLL